MMGIRREGYRCFLHSCASFLWIGGHVGVPCPSIRLDAWNGEPPSPTRDLRILMMELDSTLELGSLPCLWRHGTACESSGFRFSPRVPLICMLDPPTHVTASNRRALFHPLTRRPQSAGPSCIQTSASKSDYRFSWHP